ncbi:MAG: hypothetical protein CSA25_05095 [Desulfobacter postgatei]|uniref:Uncharacterized protein n=1 Tax=Desulfobacter postgatei TaxID=2293 RepID=A0A2G6MS48_9BACT|nr:MAG: hypothetical protein CSA25_05095 [Desulfobacter postgatei]
MKKSIFAVLVTGLFLLGMAGSASAVLLDFPVYPDGSGYVTLGTDMEWEDGYLYTNINTEPSADLFFNDTVYLNEFQMGGGDGIATVTGQDCSEEKKDNGKEQIIVMI